MNEHPRHTSVENNLTPPAQRIIATIKREHIEPAPRWHALLRNSAFWATLVLMIFLGSLFLAVFLSNALDIGPDIFRAFRFERFLSLLILTSPLFWMTLSIITVASGVFAFRKTRYGYRWSALSLAGFFVLTLGLVAFGSHIAQIDERFEQSISRDSGPFRSFAPPREERWLHPGSGILVGNITKIDDRRFFLNTETDEIWTVFITNETHIGRNVTLATGESVVVLGDPIEAHDFRALLIRPLRIPHQPLESTSQYKR